MLTMALVACVSETPGITTTTPMTAAKKLSYQKDKTGLQAQKGPHIAHGGGTEHDHTHAGLAPHRHFPISKRVFDRPHGGFDRGAQVLAAGASLGHALAALGDIDLRL